MSRCDNHRQACGTPVPRAAVINPWLKLLMGMIGFVLFLAGLGYVSERLPAWQEQQALIRYYDLRPSAIYYTDYEVSADAAALIRSSLEYVPAKRFEQRRPAVKAPDIIDPQ